MFKNMTPMGFRFMAIITGICGMGLIILTMACMRPEMVICETSLGFTPVSAYIVNLLTGFTYVLIAIIWLDRADMMDYQKALWGGERDAVP